MSRAVWSADEIKVLLNLWAEPGVQEQLRSTQRNERVFAQLSSELATHGFDKTTSQCRFKIKQLKQKYKHVREQKDSKKQRSRWFAMLDKVLGRCEPQTEVVDSDQQDLSETEEDLGKIHCCFYTLPWLTTQCMTLMVDPTAFNSLFSIIAAKVATFATAFL